MSEENIDEIIEVLEELAEDTTVPKNVKARLAVISEILKSGDEKELIVDKALQEMDELGSDNNMQAYTRAQIWNIVSMLESL